MSAAALVIACSLLAQTGDRYGAPPSAQPSGDDSREFIYNPVTNSDNRSNGTPDAYGNSRQQAPLPTTMPAEGSGQQGASQSAAGQQSNSSRTRNSQPPDRSAATNRANESDRQRLAANDSADTEVEDGYKPVDLMTRMLAEPPGARLPGEKIALATVISGANSRPAQTERVEGYWDLCSSVADYYLSLRELSDYHQCSAKVSSDNESWKRFGGVLNSRVNTSQQAAVASQQRLASLVGSTPSGQLPLPGDLPHCGDYFPHYEEIFAQRPSPEAKQLSELLPLRYQELKLAAKMVRDDEEFSQRVASSSSRDYADGVIKALKVLALQRRAFVQIAKDYNRRIARYSELATPGRIETERLVKMLIKRDQETSTATRPMNRSVAPSRYGRQSRLERSARNSTFAGNAEWAPRSGNDLPEKPPRDEAVRPAAAEAPAAVAEGEERSVLVPAL